MRNKNIPFVTLLLLAAAIWLLLAARTQAAQVQLGTNPVPTIVQLNFTSNALLTAASALTNAAAQMTNDLAGVLRTYSETVSTNNLRLAAGANVTISSANVGNVLTHTIAVPTGGSGGANLTNAASGVGIANESTGTSPIITAIKGFNSDHFATNALGIGLRNGLSLTNVQTKMANHHEATNVLTELAGSIRFEGSGNTNKIFSSEQGVPFLLNNSLVAYTNASPENGSLLNYISLRHLFPKLEWFESTSQFINGVIRYGATVTNLSARGINFPNLGTSEILATDGAGNATNTGVASVLVTNLVGVTSPIQSQLNLLTPLTTYSGGTNQLWDHIQGPWTALTDPSSIDLSDPRQVITISATFAPTFSNTNDGVRASVFFKVASAQTITFPGVYFPQGTPTNSWSGTNWFTFAVVGSTRQLVGFYDGIQGDFATTNFAVSVASNFVHVAAGANVTVTTNVSDGKRIFTIAAAAGSGEVTYADQIATSNIIWRAKADATNGTIRGLTIPSNIVWTVRNQTAASSATNFVVDFSPQSAGAVQLTGANITNLINVAHSTNWPSGGEATVTWTIFTTITNRHFYIPSAFQSGVYGTNSASQFLLPSNKVVTVSFKSLTGANSGVIFNAPIWNDQAFGGTGDGEVSYVELGATSNTLAIAFAAGDTAMGNARVANSSGLGTNLTVRGLTVASNIVYAVATGAAVANLTNWVVDFSPNAASEVDIYSNAITNKIHILHTTNWPSGRAFVAWNIYTGITNRHLGLATSLQKVIGTNYEATVSDILLPSNTMARVTFMSTTNSNAGARMTYPIVTAWP